MSNSSSGFDPNRFAEYASLKNPDKTISNVYLSHTDRTVTIIEEYPKSRMHFIMIPRVGAPPRVPMNLTDLYTWLTSPEVTRSEAQTLLQEMKEDAEKLLPDLKEQMKERYGYLGNFWMGFKVNPSYRYLHLHILSDDLCGLNMKTPRHFFSFHPYHGELLRFRDVLEWFDIVEERFQDNLEDMRKKKLSLKYPNDEERGTKPYNEYDCYHNDGLECCFVAKDLPTMKAHLMEHETKRKERFTKQKQQREAYRALRARAQARQAEAEVNQQETE